MKIFTQQSITEEVFQNMQLNLVKNASEERQATSIQRNTAIERLCEAAELYDQIGNEKKAHEITCLIEKFVHDENQREIQANNKVSALKIQIQKLASAYDNSSLNSINYHYLNLASEKISTLLSKIANTKVDSKFSNIKNSLKDLNSNVQISTPANITLLSDISKIADDTLSAVEEEDESQDPSEIEESWEDE